jgi:hypothetical protein
MAEETRSCPSCKTPMEVVPYPDGELHGWHRCIMHDQWQRFWRCNDCRCYMKEASFKDPRPVAP